MNGFAQAYLDQGGSTTLDLPPLGFMDSKCVPVSTWFAENFAICDRWFSCLPSSTHPNKLMALAGKSVVDDTFALIPQTDTLLDWLNARNIEVYRALNAAPVNVPSRTTLIIIHDEHGGFWDHVPPHPTPAYRSLTGRVFDTTGPRVPALIISPLVSPRRVVNNLVFDHTSILQFVAECFAPGGGSYSHEVDLRENFGISSVSQALDLASPRPMPPVPNITVSAPATLQLLRPVQTEAQRAFAHAVDGILSSQYRSDVLAQIPELHTWDDG